MWQSLSSISVIIVFFVQNVAGSEICDNESQKTLSCTSQILGQDNTDYNTCKVVKYPNDSHECKVMSFGPLTSNTHIGGVVLKPRILAIKHNQGGLPYFINHTVINITFSNIKWKIMKFRFQSKHRDMKNHCRNIVLSNDVTIDDQSILYYDCFWPVSYEKDDQSHILDFEATDDISVNRGQYYFNVPSTKMLSPTVKESEWKPFIYIEILSSTMRLHIMPPPVRLKINSYRIKVMKDCKDAPCEIKSKTWKIRNNTSEVTYDYNFLGENGLYYFSVEPLHESCEVDGVGCTVVESPKITISNEIHPSLNICIASITALIVATLFIYYVILRVIRKYWCKDYRLAMANEIPPPTKVLVIYSPANRLHAECVASFVSYLGTEYGFDIMYDGDIANTSHGDPYVWAQEAFSLASHIMYIVGPAEETNLYNSIYDKPIITAHKDVDVLLLSLIKANRATRSPKEVINVFFEHSNGQIPIETKHDRAFFLLKDWQKLISYLSKNLLPKKMLLRTERGRCFLEDLTRAKKLLGAKKDDVVVSDKNNFEKKILL